MVTFLFNLYCKSHECALECVLLDNTFDVCVFHPVKTCALLVSPAIGRFELASLSAGSAS